MTRYDSASAFTSIRDVPPDYWRFDPPRFSCTRLLEELTNQFGMAGRLTPLEGERDQNHKVTTSGGRAYVLKVSGALEDPGVVDFQTKALQHIASQSPDLAVPRVIPTLMGRDSGIITSDIGVDHIVRLLTYLPGVPFSQGNPPGESAIKALGQFCAHLCQSLSTFTHSHSRHFMPWDMTNGLILSDSLWKAGLGDIRALEGALRPRFEAVFGNALDRLRRQVVHNDLYLGNVLRQDHTSATVVGVIDFGDMVEVPMICDLAILAAGFVDFDDPLSRTALVVRSFHESVPLQPQEIDRLHDLIFARRVQSVLLFDHRVSIAEHPSAHLVEQRSLAMTGVEKILEIGPERFRDRFMRTVSLQP